MKIFIMVFHFSAILALGQTQDPAFAHMLSLTLQHYVPEINTADVQSDQYYFLDCRERSEYEVSHIPNAIFVGPKPDKTAFLNIPKDKPWLLYCSVGVRSEEVTHLAMNHHNECYNLVGGIFEWVNEGRPVVDENEKPTEKVHPYNRVWGVWLKAGLKSFE